jgi:hypothetical protein
VLLGHVHELFEFNRRFPLHERQSVSNPPEQVSQYEERGIHKLYDKKVLIGHAHELFGIKIKLSLHERQSVANSPEQLSHKK